MSRFNNGFALSPGSDLGSSPQSTLRSSNLRPLPNISENYQHEFDIQPFTSTDAVVNDDRDFFTSRTSTLDTNRRDNSPLRQTLKPNNSLQVQTPNVVPHTAVKDWQPKSVTYIGTASLASPGANNFVRVLGNTQLQQHDGLDSSFSRDLSPLRLSPTTNVCGVERNQSLDSGCGSFIHLKKMAMIFKYALE